MPHPRFSGEEISRHGKNCMSMESVLRLKLTKILEN